MKWILMLGAPLSVLTACQDVARPVAATTVVVPTPAPEPATEKHGPHDDIPSRVRLSDAAQRDARLRLEEVQQSRLAPTVDLTGEVVADPDRMARVAARAAGRVVDVRFKEGEVVTKGAVLVVMECPELARARALLTSASARAAAALQNAQRLESMAQQGLATTQLAAGAMAEAKALNADALAARQSLAAFGLGTEPGAADAASRLTLRAPISGVVVARNAVVGETVGAERTFATVVDLERAYFQARLFERNLAAVLPGLHADVHLNAYPDAVISGVVESVGYQVDPVARTVVARIAVPNTDGTLRLGLFGTARVAIRGAAVGNEVLTIPLSAVTRIGAEPVAFVAHAGGDYEAHPLVLGASAAGRVEVLSGLSLGEKVVVEGVFALKSVLLKSTFGEED